MQIVFSQDEDRKNKCVNNAPKSKGRLPILSGVAGSHTHLHLFHVFTFDSKTKINFPFFIFNIEEKVVQSYFYHVNFKIT